MSDLTDQIVAEMGDALRMLLERTQAADGSRLTPEALAEALVRAVASMPAPVFHVEQAATPVNVTVQPPPPADVQVNFQAPPTQVPEIKGWRLTVRSRDELGRWQELILTPEN